MSLIPSLALPSCE